MKSNEHPDRSAFIACCAILSGASLGCCFYPIDCVALAWFGMAPLGVVLTAPRLTGRAWAGVYFGGLLHHLLALCWLLNLCSRDGSFGPYTPGWLVTGQAGAVLLMLAVLLGRRAFRATRAPMTIGLPIFWVAFEWYRAAASSLVDPAAAPWVRLGGTQVDWLAIAQLAGLGGESLIVALIAMVNGALFDVARWVATRPRAAFPRFALASPMVLVGAVVYGEWRLALPARADGPVVALRDREDWLPMPDVPATTPDGEIDLLVWPELATHHKLITGGTPTADTLPEDVRLVAGPEAADYDGWVRERLATAAALARAGVLVGCERVDLAGDRQERFNSLAYASPSRGFVGWCDKAWLAPFSERPIHALGWLELPLDSEYAVGTESPLFPLESGSEAWEFACLVCYDIAFAERSRTVARRGAADFLVHCGSEAADQSGGLSEILLRMARLRAIENHRAIVRNCHRGRSGVVDGCGRYSPWDDDPGGEGAVVPLYGVQTVFAACGDWAGPLAFWAVVVGCAPWPAGRRRVGPPARHARSLGRRLSRRRSRAARSAFSLLELLAVVAVLGTIAALLLPRVADMSDTAKEKVDEMNRGQINAAVERYYLTEGVWPANNLSDIGANAAYFPEGIPTNPVDGSAYQLNATTHRVMAGGGGGGK